MKLDKHKLIAAIKDLLQNDSLETQEGICQILGKRGFDVNQALVSRTLNKLGAVKMKEGDSVYYRLPSALTAHISATSQNDVSNLVLNIANNESLIVIRTTPGSAQLLASFLDHRKELEILGTVAGDDTIFVSPKSCKKIDELSKKLYELLFS